MLQQLRNNDLSVFILAGGMSKRMGTSKAFLPFGGRELIERAISLGKALTRNVFISGNSLEYSQFGLPLINDKYDNSGPLGGIYSCLDSTKTEKNIFLPCDAPFLSVDIYIKLLSQMGDADIVTLKNNGNIEPFASVFSKTVVSATRVSIEKKQLGLIRFISTQNTKYVDSVYDNQKYALSFFNCNTPEELKTAYQLHKNSLPFRENMIIVAGGGRNTGKTTLAEKLINRFSKSHKVLALKISPHFHHSPENERFNLMEETALTKKDSSRLLQAGAYKSLYAECEDDGLVQLLDRLKLEFDEAQIIIAETAGLANFVRPGILIYCESHDELQKNQWLRDIADITLGYDMADKERFHEMVSFVNKSFVIKKEL